MSFRDLSGKIWVVSDTHLRSDKFLPDAFRHKVSREDIILHLGDFVSFDVVRGLRNIARLEAVHGNCDPPDLRKEFPSVRVIEIAGKRIGMTHGGGPHSDALRRVTHEFQGKVDIALFGHTHRPYHSKSGGTLFFNPGSLTDGRGNSSSFGLLHLAGEIYGEIFEL